MRSSEIGDCGTSEMEIRPCGTFERRLLLISPTLWSWAMTISAQRE